MGRRQAEIGMTMTDDGKWIINAKAQMEDGTVHPMLVIAESPQELAEKLAKFAWTLAGPREMPEPPPEMRN